MTSSVFRSGETHVFRRLTLCNKHEFSFPSGTNRILFYDICITIRRKKGHTEFWWKNMRERDHLGYLGIDGMIILKLIFRKCYLVPSIPLC
jgi:hypothetical protein